MAARRALEWIGMFEGPAGVLDMKYQTCLMSDFWVKYITVYAYYNLIGSSCSQCGRLSEGLATSNFGVRDFLISL